MKIPSAQIDSLLKNIASKFRAALIYGPDYGQAMEKSNEIVTNFFGGKPDDFRFFDYNFDEVKDNIDKLRQSAFSVSFFGGNKLIRIKDCGNTISKEIESIISSLDSSCFVLFVASDLPPASSLRKLFEQKDNIAAIACYKDDFSQVSKLIYNYFAKAGVKISSDAINIIAEQISGDRMLLNSELEKILIYIGNNKEITINDLENLVFKSKDVHGDELVYNLFSKKTAEVIKDYDIVIAEISEVGLLRFTLKYCYKLLEVTEMINSGSSADNAIGQLKPPIFFKHQRTVINHVKNLNTHKVLDLITKLSELEIYFKSSAYNPSVFKQRLLSLLS